MSSSTEETIDSEGTSTEVDADAGSETIITSFTEIISDKDILACLAKNNFTTPTPVQVATIPPALEGRDLIVQAQTGSGKTLAFSIPLVDQLFKENPDKKQTYGLIVTPTRELAEQVAEVVSVLHAEITPVCAIGGVDISKQIKALKVDKRVVVGTPGRLLDLIRQKELSLKKCRFFALDEADEMLSMGFLEDVRAILSRLPNKRQGMFVSATITPRVDMLAGSFLSKPKQVLLEIEEDLIPEIEHLYYEVGSDLMAKPQLLCDIIETRRPASAIIFCNTKSDTSLVEALLRRRGFDARRLNSDLTQAQRQRVMKKIRDGELQFLIATDIAARGIDIEEIELVVNFSIHEQPETYVHRTGRTGRAGKRGCAISLVGPKDFGAFHFIRKVLDKEFVEVECPSDVHVADARLAHLYEVLRTSGVEHKERDKIVATKFLKEMGSIEDPPEELIDQTAKLCRHAIEHFVKLEAQALEEELETEQKSTSSSSEKGKSKGRGRKSRSDGEDADEVSEREDRDEVRLYVGQGLSHGMNAKSFTDLATSLAGLEADDIKNASFRDFYGFVDLDRKNSDKVIESINGVQFKDAELPIEFACSLTIKKPRRSGGRRPSRSRDGRSRDRDRKGSRKGSRTKGNRRGSSDRRKRD